jgi:zinc transporter ZupT
MVHQALIPAVVAGILASLACGLGVVPLLIERFDVASRAGLGYATAAGLMFAASVYNLILPGLGMADHAWTLMNTLPVLGGVLLGAVFLSVTTKFIDGHAMVEKAGAQWGGRTGLLIFIAMSIHSIPEGVAVGTGYVAGATYDTQLGGYIALAIAIHNIPEGLAVAIPMRSAGVSLHRCFWAAVLTSLPQPIAAVPAVLASWVFEPLMPVLMGFAAGAMIFLVVLELIPEALESCSQIVTAWAFTLGFCGMVLVQVLL